MFFTSRQGHCALHLLQTADNFPLPPDFHPLPDDKILDWSKLKAFADDKLNVTQNIKNVVHRIENIVGKEENAGDQHFLLFPQCFKRLFPSEREKSSL